MNLNQSLNMSMNEQISITSSVNRAQNNQNFNLSKNLKIFQVEENKVISESAEFKKDSIYAHSP